MDLHDFVSSEGGVVRVADLRAQGCPRRAIEGAVAAGALIRPRKGWVASRDADPEVVAAARIGGVLTCVTQARRLGLWVAHEQGAHIAAPAHGHVGDAREGTRIHWSRPVVARHPALLEDHVENVLSLVSGCLPREEALVIWESALRKDVVDREHLARMPLPAPARTLLEASSSYSDSGLETLLPARLRFLRLPMRQQVWIDDRPVDHLIGERLVVQIDGGHHVGSQRRSDIAHDARLMLLGYHVIRLDYVQVMHRWTEVHDLIVRAVAQGLHRAA
ncbi:MAG: DUF559 domain-containing protein [Microbacterium sp.]|uniref:type IV toxin-antitoxin system AbiEi family antitoxin domain-containing protein n=1 Tax=Microbacterium sp. TaxID=51671 RepID=UPI001AD4F239|nr:type IV toxin-antitoxin system AbiEi family antitoxin domain-containing protein [Microbacterium sp.]MBN9153469.1 DUF559 domain-containing protein [Microbacterium sp.]MBN9172543.1 DUF559 domain-containing protein [Microbacterium sp.]MBN9185954.1 DUF559 domain-containing protein [Microbacterium sp.]MBN9190413.1 DUF559 domain-containing protein [Microbacterium sp.]